MLELAFRGTKRYWAWIFGLLVVAGVGMICYVKQLDLGLMVTGQGRDVSWGFYTAQMTFLVGVAAGGVMLVLPYYLHDYKTFSKITILGEFLAVAALIMCFLYLFVHLGQPVRAFNIFLHPTPNSMLFWDGLVLGGYLTLNIVIGWVVLESERNAVPPPAWVKPLIYLSIPMAFGIHTITAYIYCGLPGRGFWLTAILAPRFLASAFASGPAFLILLILLLRRITGFDPGKKAIQAMAIIVTYSLIANLFFLCCELFVVFYSGIPEHMDHFKYLYAGYDGHNGLVPWMWASVFLLIAAAVLMIVPDTRRNERILAMSCGCIFVGIWIDKGLGMITGGFTPSPLHTVTEYLPTIFEIIISLGIYAIGFLVLSILYKIVIEVKAETGA